MVRVKSKEWDYMTTACNQPPKQREEGKTRRITFLLFANF